eukprot:365733-Chlamydomonas_euryale.AAC.23
MYIGVAGTTATRKRASVDQVCRCVTASLLLRPDRGGGGWGFLADKAEDAEPCCCSGLGSRCGGWTTITQGMGRRLEHSGQGRNNAILVGAAAAGRPLRMQHVSTLSRLTADSGRG